MLQHLQQSVASVLSPFHHNAVAPVAASLFSSYVFAAAHICAGEGRTLRAWEDFIVVILMARRNDWCVACYDTVDREQSVSWEILGHIDDLDPSFFPILRVNVSSNSSRKFRTRLYDADVR